MKKNYLSKAFFRFYEELNDFLSTSQRKKEFSFIFFGKPTVKDAIEAIGVPHTEVDLILVNGVSVSFNHHLQEGDRVSVYPVFESLDIKPLTRLRPEPLRAIKFIADVHLGRLVKYLRLLGFDTFYDPSIGDEEIIKIGDSEKRMILTRDLGILKNGRVKHGYWLRSTDPKEQVKEIVRRFDLKKTLHPFTRCLECNALLKKVEKEEILEKLLPDTQKFYATFFQCPSCKRIYWEGSHYHKMRKFINEIKT